MEHLLKQKRDEIATYEAFRKAASARKEHKVRDYYDAVLRKLRQEYMAMRRKV